MRFILLLLLLSACGGGDDGPGGSGDDAAPVTDAAVNPVDAAPGLAMCEACEQDEDCAQPARCIEVGGDLRCAPDCGGDPPCDRGDECVSDQCVPLYGACVGDGAFCTPCLEDGDCTTGEDPTCATLAGGERACIDMAFGDSCEADEDCPVAPSGLPGECLDADDGVSEADARFHRCYAPYLDAIDDYGCWP